MKAKTPVLTPQQKAQILGDNIDELAGHLLAAAVKGGYALPITALSRKTDVLLGYFKKAGQQKVAPTKGRAVLIFTL